MLLPLGILLAHLVGDYIFQNNSMAQRKTSSWGWAFVHGVWYTFAYFILNVILVSVGYPGFSWWALVIIGATHVVIDRLRLVKYLIWAVNNVPFVTPAEDRYSLAEARENSGYAKGVPPYLSTWLMIIVDNTVHILINVLAIWLLWR